MGESHFSRHLMGTGPNTFSCREERQPPILALINLTRASSPQKRDACGGAKRALRSREGEAANLTLDGDMCPSEENQSPFNSWKLMES